MKKTLVSVLFFGLLAASLALGQAGKKPAGSAKPTHARPHVMVAPGELKWSPPPAGMMVGTPPPDFNDPVQVAVLEGDPSKAGAIYTMRIKTGDGARVAPHWHPQDENITVLKGTFYLATGDKFDTTAGHAMDVGSYALMPKGVHHFGWCKGETIVQVYGVGPFKIIWLGSAAAKPHKAAAK